jgi:hypothetical protein
VCIASVSLLQEFDNEAETLVSGLSVAHDDDEIDLSKYTIFFLSVTGSDCMIDAVRLWSFRLPCNFFRHWCLKTCSESVCLV